MSSLPSRLKVGIHEYTVTEMAGEDMESRWPDEEGFATFGMCRAFAAEIYVRKDYRETPLTSMKTREYLLHEVLHAVCSQAGTTFGDEESVVASVAPTLLMVLRDNPELVTYLTREEKPSAD